jgi:GTPase
MKTGQLVIVGRPNVGKSTLVNALVREKVAIVSDKPQTTRSAILGVGHYPQGQLMIVDTPGLHTPRHRLNAKMVQSAIGTLSQADVVYVVVDSQVSPGPGDRFVVEQVAKTQVEHAFRGVFLLLNKADVVAKPRLLPLIDEYRTWFAWTDIVPLSAKTGVNLSRLLDLTFGCLPEGSEPVVEADYLTNQSMRQMAGEMIREQVLERTRAELPYAVGVCIEQFLEGPTMTEVHAVILVEKNSQKGIVIGKGGSRLKEIGQAAREEMERLFHMKIFLKIWVKVQEGWRDDPRLLSALGYGEGDVRLE